MVFVMLETTHTTSEKNMMILKVGAGLMFSCARLLNSIPPFGFYSPCEEGYFKYVDLVSAFLGFPFASFLARFLYKERPLQNLLAFSTCCSSFSF